MSRLGRHKKLCSRLQNNPRNPNEAQKSFSQHCFWWHCNGTLKTLANKEGTDQRVPPEARSSDLLGLDLLLVSHLQCIVAGVNLGLRLMDYVWQSG